MEKVVKERTSSIEKSMKFSFKYVLTSCVVTAFLICTVSLSGLQLVTVDNPDSIPGVQNYNDLAIAISTTLGDQLIEPDVCIRLYGSLYTLQTPISINLQGSVIQNLTIESAYGAESCLIYGAPVAYPGTNTRVFFISGVQNHSIIIKDLSFLYEGLTNTIIDIVRPLSSFEFRDNIVNTHCQAIRYRYSWYPYTAAFKINNNTFIRHHNPALPSDPWSTLDIKLGGATEIDIRDNEFQNAIMPISIQCYEQITTIRGNTFSADDYDFDLGPEVVYKNQIEIHREQQTNPVNSSLLTFSENTLENVSLHVNEIQSNIAYNKFTTTSSEHHPSYGLISLGYYATVNPQELTATISNNQIYGNRDPSNISGVCIRMCIVGTFSGPVNLFMDGNSFLNSDCALVVERDAELPLSNSHRVSSCKNNLFDCATIPMRFHYYGIQSEVYPVYIRHSFFVNGYPPAPNFIVDNDTCMTGDPKIDVDNVNYSYELLWNNEQRSPLILAGSGTPGFDSQDHADNYDIGVVQYDENSHENVTYTFPPYSVRNGLKWMSFPTIDRIWNPVTNDPDVALTFFSPIRFTSLLQNIMWKFQDEDLQQIAYNGVTWVGDQSHLVIPQQGYKIQMAQGLIDPEYISVPGLIPAIEDFPLEIKAQSANKADEIGNENWLGYFYSETTQAREAFEGVIDYLWFIQTQNWTMCREDKIPGSPWIYALQNGKEPALSYGDMVIVKCFEDRQFIWNTEAMNQIAMEKELPSHFVYEEKPDYVPVYIELDGTDLPTELALYVDDVCKGAVVVTDSLVEIPAYVVNNVNPNAEVQIRAFYEGKSTTDFIPEYRVWDQNSGAFLDTRLSLKSKNYYYKVKLVQSEQDAPPLAEPELKIYPNPFNPSTTIRFNIPGSAGVNLEIYNQRGQLVRILVNDLVQAGEHSISWDGKDDNHLSLPSGLYYVKLSYQNKSFSKKMVLIK